MIIFNEKKFTDIVDFYQLKDYLVYFKLFNKSKYINSYHGYEHVKRFIYSLFLLLHDKRSYDELRTMMVAAIFHDFNYIGSFNSKIEEPFDIENINAAIEAVDDAHYNKKLKFNVNLNQVKNLIKISEYPKCNHIELYDNAKFFIDCDHSMLLYSTYEFMGLLFYYNELGMRKCNDDFENIVDSYFDSIKFHSDLFMNMYNENKKDITKRYKAFIKENIELYGKDNIRDSNLAKSFNFEIIF